MNNRGNEHCGSEENEIDVVSVIWKSIIAERGLEWILRMDKIWMGRGTVFGKGKLNAIVTKVPLVLSFVLRINFKLHIHLFNQ